MNRAVPSRLHLQNSATSNKSLPILLAAVGLYIFLRLWHLTGDDLWYDEVFTVLTVRLNWTDMFSALLSDAVHPPLFYILLKLWFSFSNAVWWWQLFPFFISILTLIPVCLLCRELKFNNPATALVVAMIAVNDYFLEYSLDLRMYGLLQLFVLFSLWLFVKMVASKETKQSTIVFLTLFNLLLVYTHYFGWLIVGFEGLYVLFCKRRLLYSYFVSCAAVLIGFAPWVWSVLCNISEHKPTGNLEWIERPSIFDLAWIYATFDGNLNLPNTTFINLLIFGIPIGIMFWQKIYGKKTDSSWQILFMFAFLPVIVIFLLSHLLPKSIWGIRYLIIAAVPYILLVVKSVFDLQNKMTRYIFLTLILLWSAALGFINFPKVQNKINWSKAAENIGKTQTNQPVYIFDEWVGVPLQFYLNQQNIPAQVEKRKEISEITNRDFWLAFRNSNPAENTFIRESLYNRNCRIIQEDTYSDTSQSVLLFNVRECGLYR